MSDRPYPLLVCMKCAVRYGKKPVDKNTRPYWRKGSCHCCYKFDELIMTAAVGGLNDNWRKEK